ncbi:unnamed protein product [Larinioides sclopetarius]|uniref:Uncharacterized protein n=1 Tax=Larinioides sclopetarius TaxID=280406 RepID=A0AAV1Z604_9ARAC
MSSNDDSSSSDMESEEEYDVLLPPHRHRKRFSLIEISTRDFVRKIMIFESRCSVLPSSWEVEFNLWKGSRFENFTISVTLRRIDSGLIPLQGYVLTYLSNFDDKVCPIPYTMEGEVPFFERADSIAQREVIKTFLVNKHYRCLFMNGSETLRYDMLLIKTQFLIIGCCCQKNRKGPVAGVLTSSYFTSTDNKEGAGEFFDVEVDISSRVNQQPVRSTTWVQRRQVCGYSRQRNTKQNLNSRTN